MQIGLFGGSFNPLHNGHLHVAREALRQARLDEVWLMVSPQNPMKNLNGLLPGSLRYHLARIALHGDRQIKASNVEQRLPMPSYTWNTLQHLRQKHPEHRFHLIIGGDNWQLFSQWFRHDDILKTTPLIIYPRQTDGQATVNGEQPRNGNIMYLQGQFVNISSTGVRLMLRNGQMPDGYVPEMLKPILSHLYK